MMFSRTDDSATANEEDQMSESRTRATGTIEVTGWSPQPYDQLDSATTLVAIDVAETFQGDIEGEGRARLLQALQPDGSATFVGHERVVATLAGRSGSFVFQDLGTLSPQGDVDGSWFVVPHSGTDELVGLRGEGSFVAAVGERAVITLDYWFE
jgi:hypothetical protein